VKVHTNLTRIKWNNKNRVTSTNLETEVTENYALCVLFQVLRLTHISYYPTMFHPSPFASRIS